MSTVDVKAVDHKNFKIKPTFYKYKLDSILPIPDECFDEIEKYIITMRRVCCITNIYLIHKDQSLCLFCYTDKPVFIDDKNLKFAMNKFINSITHDFDENQIYLWYECDGWASFGHDTHFTAYIIQLAILLQKKCAEHAYNTAWKRPRIEEEGNQID